MLEFLTPKDNAFHILTDDHNEVKDLFDQFKKAKSLREKKQIAAKAILDLRIHATIEEEIFYPALRAKKVDVDILNEADEEHHVAKLLIAELDQMSGEEEHYEAKFTVLAENIKHHIREEEGEMFPKAHKADIDFDALGKRMMRRKQQLKKDGVPAGLEDKLMARNKNADSPAADAKKAQRKPVAPKRAALRSNAPKAVKKPVTKKASAKKRA